MEILKIQELTSKQIEELGLVAEKAAREYILSKVSSKKIKKLDITVEIEGTKPVTLTIEVDIGLSRLIRKIDAKKLTDMAVREAFSSAEEYLRELKCHSQT